jgi:PadR family transcriptional regulator, regulatory protein PadR
MMKDEKADVLHGSLALMVLRTLDTLGPMHGWGVAENNRRAKFYAITRAGRKQLEVESETWQKLSGVIARFLKPGEMS